MFNFFKSNKQEKLEEDGDKVISAITYYTDKDLNVRIDITMDDYDDLSVTSMATLLTVLARPETIMETFDVLKQGVTKDERPDVLVKIAQIVQSAAIELTKDSKVNEQPCVKPSEML
tara:strand:+ start:1570 stop:1920 length:351 start_codon:yes stop_codon:yes gene_type:complete